MDNFELLHSLHLEGFTWTLSNRISYEDLLTILERSPRLKIRAPKDINNGGTIDRYDDVEGDDLRLAPFIACRL